MGFAAELPLGTYEMSIIWRDAPSKRQNTCCVANKRRIRDIQRPFKGRADCGYSLVLAVTWYSLGKALFTLPLK